MKFFRQARTASMFGGASNLHDAANRLFNLKVIFAAS
jgi:hypothetical protein